MQTKYIKNKENTGKRRAKPGIHSINPVLSIINSPPWLSGRPGTEADSITLSAAPGRMGMWQSISEFRL